MEWINIYIELGVFIVLQYGIWLVYKSNYDLQKAELSAEICPKVNYNKIICFTYEYNKITIHYDNSDVVYVKYPNGAFYNPHTNTYAGDYMQKFLESLCNLVPDRHKPQKRIFSLIQK